MLVLGLASCADLNQAPPPVAAVPQPAGEAIKQAGRRDSETKPASPLNGRNSEPIQLVSHDEVVSALTLESAAWFGGSAACLDSRRVCSGRVPAPCNTRARPWCPRSASSRNHSTASGHKRRAGTIPGAQRTAWSCRDGRPGGALAVGPQPPELPPGTAAQPDNRITSLAAAAGAAEGDLALNTIGDQGIISFGPQSGKAPISVTRNFALNITDNNSAAPSKPADPHRVLPFLRGQSGLSRPSFCTESVRRGDPSQPPLAHPRDHRR